MFQDFLKFSHLHPERARFCGEKAHSLEEMTFEIHSEFQDAFAVFKQADYNCLDIEDEVVMPNSPSVAFSLLVLFFSYFQTFLTDFESFKAKVLDLKRRMATIFEIAFECSYNLEAISRVRLQLINLRIQFGHLVSLPPFRFRRCLQWCWRTTTWSTFRLWMQWRTRFTSVTQ